jgi:hypothetical protein
VPSSTDVKRVLQMLNLTESLSAPPDKQGITLAFSMHKLTNIIWEITVGLNLTRKVQSFDMKLVFSKGDLLLP